MTDWSKQFPLHNGVEIEFVIFVDYNVNLVVFRLRDDYKKKRTITPRSVGLRSSVDVCF